MIKMTCDRCGEIINTNPNSNAILPMFKISRIRNIQLGWEFIDLCPECSRMFESWLKNGDCSSVERKEE